MKEKFDPRSPCPQCGGSTFIGQSVWWLDSAKNKFKMVDEHIKIGLKGQPRVCMTCWRKRKK